MSPPLLASDFSSEASSPLLAFIELKRTGALFWIDACTLWRWRRLLRLPWTARRPNQSILKEVNPEYSLEGLKMKLKLQCFGHLIWRTDSMKRPWCWERFKAGGEGEDRRWDGWMASPTQWTWVWAASGRSWRKGMSRCCSPWQNNNKKRQEGSFPPSLRKVPKESNTDDFWGFPSKHFLGREPEIWVCQLCL